MEVNGIINMLEDIKNVESNLKEVKKLKEKEIRLFYLTLETAAGFEIKLELSEEFSESLLNFVVEQVTKDYEKNIENMKKSGIKVTNAFEKEKIEKQIKELKKELDNLWYRGLFTKGEKVQKHIEELENKLKEL